MFGIEDEFGEDALLGRLEGLKDVIEQVNRQFKDPVTFAPLPFFSTLFTIVVVHFAFVFDNMYLHW